MDLENEVLILIFFYSFPRFRIWILKIATDPKLALQKGRELWADLSKDEPENQARPQTIEELIVLITRESARRMVHLANYTGTTASKVPR